MITVRKKENNCNCRCEELQKENDILNKLIKQIANLQYELAIYSKQDSDLQKKILRSYWKKLANKNKKCEELKSKNKIQTLTIIELSSLNNTLKDNCKICNKEQENERLNRELRNKNYDA